MAKIEVIEDSDSGSNLSDDSVEDQPNDGAEFQPPVSGEKKRKPNADRSKQKDLLRERKARRLHSNVIQAARVAWGSDSIKNAPVEERIGRVEAVLHEIETLISQICLKHDVSRLVQSCLKYGNDAQRTIVANGLKGHVIELCMNQYGYHVVLKLLRYGSRAIQAGVVAELKGSLVRLCLHRIAFKVVDLAWRSTCNTKQKNELLTEIYGKEYSLLRNMSEPAPSMPALLQSLDEKKRKTLLAEVCLFLNKCIEKGTLQLSMFQTLLRHYLEHTTDRESMIDALKDQTLQICATLDGVVATCIMLDHSSPKLRKAILKSWKGQVSRMTVDSDGYLVIAKALTIVDDAVLLQKCIISELLPEMVTVMQSPAGSKVLLQVVAPGQPRYFTSAERTILKTVESMSKKPEDVRRNENLKHFVPSMLSALKSSFILACNMLRDRSLAGLFENCLRCAMEMSDDNREAAQDYIKSFTSCLGQENLTDLDENHIVAHPVAHRVLKSLCASCPSLMHPVFTEFCLANLHAVLNSRAVWILVPLVELDSNVRGTVKKALKKMDCSSVPGLKKLNELCKQK